MSNHACPHCGGTTEHAFHTRDLNRRIDEVEFTYRRCERCGLVFLVNVPAELGRYYPRDYYFLARTRDELAAWGRAERYKLDIVQAHRSSGRLIEVGPASGAFSYLAKEAGFEVTAIEMDERCAQYLAREIGVHVIHSADEARAVDSAPSADVIAMWHVIEHLTDPWRMVEAAAQKLRPGGILILAAPNPHAAQFKLFGSHWVHVDAPRHVWLIPAEVLAACGAKAGLRVRELTTRDPGSLFWNRFGWEYSLANVLRLRPGGRWLSRVARLATAAASVVEGREGRGAAYTLVLEKPI